MSREFIYQVSFSFNPFDPSHEPEKYEMSKKRSETYYNTFKNKLMKAFQDFQIDSPAVSFDQSTYTIKVGYCHKELQALGLGHYFKEQFYSNGMFDKSHEQNQKQKDVIKEATHFFESKTFELQPKPKNDSTISPSNKAPELISQLLHTNAGISLGESHVDLSPKKFLIENMKEFKQNGVQTIFFEHLCSELHQGELDEYMKSPPGAPMPIGLALYLHALDEGHMMLSNGTPNFLDLKTRYNYTEVVKAAKQEGIRVVAIDTDATYSIDADSDTRIKIMNYQAKKIIDNNKDSSKWICFVGSAHINTYHKIPGMSELTGTPSLVIEDFSKTRPLGVATNVIQYRGEINPDFVFVMDPNEKKDKDLPFEVTLTLVNNRYKEDLLHQNSDAKIDDVLLISKKIITSMQKLKDDKLTSETMKDTKNTLKKLLFATYLNEEQVSQSYLVKCSIHGLMKVLQDNISEVKELHFLNQKLTILNQNMNDSNQILEEFLRKIDPTIKEDIRNIEIDLNKIHDVSVRFSLKNEDTIYETNRASILQANSISHSNFQRSAWGFSNHGLNIKDFETQRKLCNIKIQELKKELSLKLHISNHLQKKTLSPRLSLRKDQTEFQR